MASIRVHCQYCGRAALVWPEQVLLVSWAGSGTYLFFCPACGRISDGPAGPVVLLLLVAAGVPDSDAAPQVRREQS
jgi:hypothetical protein